MDEARQARRSSWREIRMLEKSVPGVKWYRGELVFMSLFVNIFGLGLPIFILQVYDRVLPSLGLTTMQFLVIGLIAVMLLDSVLKTIRSSISSYSGARFEHMARCAAVDHLLRTPQDIYERQSPGAYLDKVNAIAVVKEFYSSQLSTIFIDLPFAIFFLGMIWFLGGPIVAVPLGLFVLFATFAGLVGRKLRRAVNTRTATDNQRYDFVIEIIRGIHTVKAQALKALMQRRFEKMQESSARAVQDVAFYSTLAQGLGSLFSQLNMAAVIGTGAILVIDGGLSAGELAACTLLSGRAMQPLQSAMGMWTNFQTIRVSAHRALEVMELPAEDSKGLPAIPALDGRVEMRHVVFAYGGPSEPPFFDDLDLEIAPGEMVGIEGDNSSGRSTLLKLMNGMIRPRGGQVLLDGHDIAKFSPQSYRRQMALITADAEVFSGSILDNLTYYRGGRYIEKALKLARELGLDEEVKRMPDGYDTRVGDGAGGLLPAGFRQRIAIIRNMLDEPKVVLFDEGNHGLDAQADKIVMEYFERQKGKATIILVSQRPSWLRMADRRFVMGHGELLAKIEDAPKPLPSPAMMPKPMPEPMPAAATVPAPAQPAVPIAATPAAANPTPTPVETAAPTAAPTPVAAPAPEPAAKPAAAAPGPTPAPAASPKPKPALSAKPQPVTRPAATAPASPPAPAPQRAARAQQAPAPHRPTPRPEATRPQPAPTPTARTPETLAPRSQAAEPRKPAPARPTAPQPAPRAAAPAAPKPAPSPSRPAAPAATPAAPRTVAQPKPAAPTPAPRPAAAAAAAKPEPKTKPSAAAATSRQEPAPQPRPAAPTPSSAPSTTPTSAGAVSGRAPAPRRATRSVPTTPELHGEADAGTPIKPMLQVPPRPTALRPAVRPSVPTGAAE